MAGPDKSKAYGLLKSAADAGDPRALMELGRLAAWPEEDDNTKPNIAKAKHYLRAAMARGILPQQIYSFLYCFRV